VRGAGDAFNGQIKSRVSRNSHIRYGGQSYCTKNIKYHTVRFSVRSVKRISVFLFSKKEFFSPRKDKQNKKIKSDK
jgi:hypothetical protein